RFADIKIRDIGYAGLKDRNAVTRQWFSIDLAGKPEPDWQAFNNDEYTIETVTRSTGKLKRTAVKENRFTLVLRELEGDITELESRLQKIKHQGVPNYFGEQRFGRDGNNLDVADALFSGEKKLKKHQRGIYFSAARSYIFNQVLSKRVETGNWNQAMAGDVMQLAGSHSCFLAEEITDEIQQRIQEKDICPTGPMWGGGELQSDNTVRQLETDVISDFQAWTSGLEAAGLKQDRRSLCVQLNDLNWDLTEKFTLILSFGLTAGSYATSFLREVVDYK
ncbi:MAG: tRNA pseudouridine(13) synthase TruD, partial [Candidatus Heimdallarchaeota archaeon]|nr:tRNA pseudouridine(13) synthase TruD [Candidatus Heimdallarchaeota archaeon]